MNFPRAGKTTLSTVRAWKWTSAILVILLAGVFIPGRDEAKSPGKQSSRETAPPVSVADKPQPLQAGYSLFYQQGNTNAVLNAMRVGLDAFQLGYRNEAKEMFDRAIAGIEAVYANNEKAQQARSKWREEKMKDFKGEPYERVMAYYYRGILYYQDGDYDNAGACFRGGMLQDAFAEEQQYRCDFALLSFLDYWSAMSRGNPGMARQSLQDLKDLRPDFTVPSPDSNVLFIVEMGPSPRKLSDGVGHYELKLFRGKNRGEVKARLFAQGGTRTLAAYPIEDVALQAMTRGGRQFGKLLYGQAEFRSTASDTGAVLSDIGTNAMITSAGLAGSAASNLEVAGAALSVVGAGAQLVAMKVKAQADTRYWDNLPESVHLAATQLEPGQHQLEARFYDSNGVELSEYRKAVSVNVPLKGDVLVWVRSRELLTSGKPHPSTIPRKQRHKRK